jgi:predicted RNA-binding Zn ribbon-like protein
MAHPTPSVEPAFLYVGGDPALDFVNTVDWTPRGLDGERLSGYDQVTRWAEGAAVLAPTAGRRLRRALAERPGKAASALTDVHRTREVLHDLFGAVARGEPPGPALLRFNRLLAEALEHLELGPEDGESGRRHAWRWKGMESDPRAVLWPVVWSAAELLRSDEAANVRICDGDDCGWMYVDRSRNGLRRWCQMRTCGTREKTRRRRVSA